MFGTRRGLRVESPWALGGEEGPGCARGGRPPRPPGLPGAWPGLTGSLACRGGSGRNCCLSRGGCSTASGVSGPQGCPAAISGGAAP
eukprot:3083883-Alexandrium_andersonii.AAC.1